MDDNKKEVVNLNRPSFSSSSDTYLLEKARKLLRGNNRESSPSSSINSPSWKAQPTLKAQSRFSTENGLQGQPQPRPPASGEAKSSIAVNGSPRIDDVNEHSNYQDVIVGSKKRKTQPTWTWTEHVRLSPGNALEGPPDDGYSWRKYGQKEILGSKYPRSYYACTYRQISDCRARKQVQRSNNDPTVLEILYTGAHTCNHQESSGSASPSPSPPPEKQELKDSIDAVDQYLDFPSDKQEALKKRRRTR